MSRHSWLALALTLGACTDASTPATPDAGPLPDGPPPPVTTRVYLTPTQHLARASLALRGVRPSVEELEAVAADPEALPGLIDGFLNDERFARTIEDLHNESLLVRAEVANYVPAAKAPFDPATVTARDMSKSILEEPLRLISHVVMADRPYTEIVTANYTMADQTVATVWGLPHVGAPDVWEETPIPDARGAAGILSTAQFYNRWRSAGANYNRGRANAISRSLLCFDFLDSDIHLDTSIDLSDTEAVSQAVVENVSCAGCHQALDPLASYVNGFRNSLSSNIIEAYPLQPWLPNLVNRWMVTTKRPPGYFGQAPEGLAGLGQAIAEDPRFAKCAATHFASYLSEVPASDLPRDWVARLQQDFVATNFNAKQLAKAVVLSDEFRVAHDTDALVAETVVGLLKLRPEQLDSSLADLTGIDWHFDDGTTRLAGMKYGDSKLMRGDIIGYRVLAGGIDSFFVTEPSHTMNATARLVTRRAAEAAAGWVVVQDERAPDAASRRLFKYATPADADETLVRAELAYLHARIYSELVAPDSTEVDELYALFSAVATATNPRRAWLLTLTAMFSDSRHLFY